MKLQMLRTVLLSVSFKVAIVRTGVDVTNLYAISLRAQRRRQPDAAWKGSPKDPTSHGLVLPCWLHVYWAPGVPQVSGEARHDALYRPHSRISSRLDP